MSMENAVITQGPLVWKEGDVVEWSSQASGCVTHKRGTIVAVVPPNTDVRKILEERKPGKMRRKLYYWEKGTRPQESYLVKVVGKGIYWPRVKQLLRVYRANPDIVERASNAQQG